MTAGLARKLEQALAAFDLADLRDDLPQRSTGVEYRDITAINGATAHYNGPPTSVRPNRDSEVAYYHSIAQYHVDKVWATTARGVPIHGAGIMYGFGIGPSGTLYWLRHLEAVTWHCANQYGNTRSLPFQLPLGGNQDATPDQWETAVRFMDAMGGVFGFDRKAIKGHREWPKYEYRGGRLVQVPNSPCPGPLLMRRLELYRRGPEAVQYRVIAPAGLKVRQGPAATFDVALGGKAVMPQGHRFIGDTIVPDGEPVDGDPRWVHRIDGLGFMPMAWLEVWNG